MIKNDINIGDYIIIGNIDNSISRYFSKKSNYGLLDGKVVKMKNSFGVFVKDIEKGSLTLIPYKNIYRTFKKEDYYNSWKTNFLRTNKSKIFNEMSKIEKTFYLKVKNKGMSVYMRNKYFYEKAIRNIAYKELTNNKIKESER